MTDISYIDRWMDYPRESIPKHRIVMSITRSDKFEDLVDITYYSVLEPIPTSSYTTHFFRFLPVKFGEYPPAPDERYWIERDNQTPSLFDDIENEYLPEERWFGYPEFKPQPDQICIFRYMDEGFNFYDVDFFEGRTWRLREKTIFAFMPVASPEGFHRRR